MITICSKAFGKLYIYVANYDYFALCSFISSLLTLKLNWLWNGYGIWNLVLSPVMPWACFMTIA